MLALRRLVAGVSRGHPLLNLVPKSRPPIQKYHDEFSKPFDNLPFRVTNRYTLTAVFCVLFGVGWWAPWLIVWYSMAKRTM